MKLCWTALIFSLCITFVKAQFTIGEVEVDTSTVVTNLDTPWEITFGPDGDIWMTERYGRISKIDTSNWSVDPLLTIPDVYEQGESGLLGLALHPQFSNDSNFVYVAYNYSTGSAIEERLVRYTYNGQELIDQEVLIDEIPAASIHNGSRLLFGADGKLYMTTGDAGDTDLSLDTFNLAGKVLRINSDGSIPEDNPFGQSYVFTIGHRNPQGLAYTGTDLVISEHGPSTDDELNYINEGANYGWPEVRGYCDSPGENTYCNQYAVTTPQIAWTPTLAVAGIGYPPLFIRDPLEAVPPLYSELLKGVAMVTLKESDFRMLWYEEGSRAIASETIILENIFGRLRDICIGRNGTIFLATSNRDGRGSPDALDDRIIMLKPANVTGLFDLSQSKRAQIHPNPVQSGNPVFLPEEVTNVKIYSVFGKLINQKAVKDNQLRLNVKPGVYFIEGDTGFRTQVSVY